MQRRHSSMQENQGRTSLGAQSNWGNWYPTLLGLLCTTDKAKGIWTSGQVHVKCSDQAEEMLSTDKRSLLAAVAGHPLSAHGLEGRCARPPNPARAGGAVVSQIKRLPRSGWPADKEVSLRYQCFVSRLCSYPSCYYKMFFRCWSERL